MYRAIFVRTNLRDFFESLALMLEAGIPQEKVKKGETFGHALEGVPYLRASSVPALAHTGEQSGTLPEMLMRYASMETKAISRFHAQLAAWLPRIVYSLVAIKVAVGIFSTGMGPRVPPEL